MDILILISSLNYGGAEKQALLDANMLSRQHNVFLATFNGGALESQLLPTVKVIKFRKTYYVKTAIQIAKFVRKNKIQIIHAHLFASSIISALAGILCDAKVIWHFHGHRFEAGILGKIALSWLSQLVYVRKLLFVNTELIGYYSSEGYRFPERKCMLMYNSSQLCFENLNKKVDKDTFKIGYIGRLVELKRVEYLIELASFLKKNVSNNFCIEIIGDGPEMSHLMKLCKQMDVENEVHLIGFQSDVISFYTSFDLFILPSREECLSLSLIDAGVLGIASIAFNVGGNDEIIDNGVTGYIINTKEEMIEKTIYLFRNTKERVSMGNNASSFCKARFSEVTHLSALNTLYKSI